MRVRTIVMCSACKRWYRQRCGLVHASIIVRLLQQRLLGVQERWCTGARAERQQGWAKKALELKLRG